MIGKDDQIFLGLAGSPRARMLGAAPVRGGDESPQQMRLYLRPLPVAAYFGRHRRRIVVLVGPWVIYVARQAHHQGRVKR